MTTDYRAIDAALPAWLAAHGLHVMTQYRDEDVRVVPVVDDSGSTFRIWFDAQVPNRLRLHAEEASASGASARRWSTEIADTAIPAALSDAWDTVEAWIAELGHTRTPCLR